MAPGDHNNVYDAFYATQHTDRNQVFLKAPVPNFVDQYKKSKKFVPGAGTYFKEVNSEMKAINQLSASPKELKMHRH